MPKNKQDFFKEFKGKTKLTEREVNLMKRRISDRKINPSQMRKNKYALTRPHINKGIIWLRKKSVRMSSNQRKALGYLSRTNSWAAMSSTNIRLVGFKERFYPVYRVSRGGQSFKYYVKFGRIHIVR